MSPDEARELFSEAFEGELDEARRSAFDAALAGDPELKREYDEFVETFRIVGKLGDEEAVPTPDLLAGVQERLRRRSRGRYYRDRFSRRTGPVWSVLLLALTSVLLLALAWFALHSTIVLEEGASAAQSAP
ncbi:MAG TPA: hypothetical protein VIL20_22085 [Sandaracinaceae bacterium]